MLYAPILMAQVVQRMHACKHAGYVLYRALVFPDFSTLNYQIRLDFSDVGVTTKLHMH